ncbi:RNA polymerase sigma-70 factor, ECF subfamily [Arachidicoccus rhizosphaerae]|uniref:RNA polymerase sigma factor n=1 Tax=Arachidicoccus rhizosphaerae TaxID=551991 RepID=A0A1H4AD20_9BACT|nr:sigma-70 family RNA polymerase sigma factor [Arachidicoccus rhizosphaerae]SEA33658.1 RNA polymerase sigma-70 factor, ECF subfamily [Arachidicoccus rhizosphaerae]
MDFEKIYQSYWQKIYRLCMGYVNDHAVAQDLAQETFITIWQQLPKFRNESNIGTWIFRIASNNCLRQIKNEKRIINVELPLNLKAEEHESKEPQIKLLYKFISELPQTDRIIISLELEDIKQAEIASIVGLSESNVRVKVHRIKEKLMKKFKEHELR